MGGNAQSVKLHPPTHPLQLTFPGILATPGHHNASDNLCFSSGILATPDYHNASFIRCFSSGIQATPDYHNACSDFLSGIQATPDYHNAWKVSLSCWPLKSDCLTQPSETTLFRPMPKKKKDACRSFFRCVGQRLSDVTCILVFLWQTASSPTRSAFMRFQGSLCGKHV